MTCASCAAARERALAAMRAGVRGDWKAAREATQQAASHVREKFTSEAERVRARLRR